jgi:hypothetical protein
VTNRESGTSVGEDGSSGAARVGVNVLEPFGERNEIRP